MKQGFGSDIPASLRPSVFKTDLEPVVKVEDQASKPLAQDKNPSSLTALIPSVITTNLEDAPVKAPRPAAATHTPAPFPTAVPGPKVSSPFPFATPAQEYERIKLYQTIDELENMRTTSKELRQKRDMLLAEARETLESFPPGKFTKAGALRVITTTSLNPKLVKIWDNQVEEQYLNYKNADKAYQAYVYGWQNKQPISFDYFKKLYAARDAILKRRGGK